MFLPEKGQLNFNQLHSITEIMRYSSVSPSIAKIMVIHVNSCEMSNRLTDGWTDGWTDGCYQAHYLSALWCCAVDNE